MAESSEQTSNVESDHCGLVFELRDRNKSMIEAWTEIFGAAGYLNSIIHVYIAVYFMLIIKNSFAV